MTVITAIKPTRRGRFALFDEGGFLFSIDGETLVLQNVREGQALDDAELELLRGQSDTRKAADQALRYLSLRAYAAQELYKKLLLKFDEHSAAAAVAKMVDLGLLNDAEFARQKAAGMLQRGKSRREVADKLRELGIDRELAAEVVAELDVDDAAAALALVQKQYLDKLRAGRRQAVEAALARRGFSRADIRDALQAAQALVGGERGDEADAGGYDETGGFDEADDTAWEAP